MAWDERSYYRDQSGSSANVVLRVLSGSVPLFTVFGVRVRAHASLLIFIAATVLIDWWQGCSIQVSATTMAMLCGVVSLHELGHCFMARWVGGNADEALLWPLGGLAITSPPHRPWPTFLTAAAGPLTNVLICLVCAGGLWLSTPGNHHWGTLDPFPPLPDQFTGLGLASAAFYFWWFYYISYVLLLFNLLPIYPLDGGQMLQTAMWPDMGYHHSMMLSTSIGIAGSILMFIVGLIIAPTISLLALWLLLGCMQQRMILRQAEDDHQWEHEHDHGMDYSASLFPPAETPRRRHVNLAALRRARKIARLEAAQRQCIDSILAKVSATGIASLSWRERRALHKATEQQRRREVELSQYR